MRSSQKKRFLRAVSVVLLGAFAVQDLAHAAPAGLLSRNLAENPSILKISPAIARIEEIHRGPAKRLLIHIQDAHTNVSGQQNLAKVLEELVTRYGVKTVFVEGASNQNSLNHLRPLAPLDVRRRIAKKYLLRGELNGEEYLSLASDHDLRLYGVEEAGLYGRNLKQYATVVSKREEVLDYIGSIERRVSALKRRVYPKDMIEFDDFLVRFERKEKDFTEYHDVLTARAESLGLRLSSYPNFSSLGRLKEKEQKIDFASANREQEKLVRALFADEADRAVAMGHLAERLKRVQSEAHTPEAFYASLIEDAKSKKIDVKEYPNLLRYVEYLNEYSRVDMAKLLDENRALEAEIFRKALPEAKAHHLHEISAHLSNLRRLFSLQASKEDFGAHVARRADVRFETLMILAFVNRELYALGNYEDVLRYVPLVNENIAMVEDFYRTTEKRDQVFMQKAFSKMDEEKTDVAVLITGGYHTTHVKELMKTRGVSYAIVTPNVTQETNMRRYEEILLGQLGDANPFKSRYAAGQKTVAEGLRYTVERANSPLVQIRRELTGEAALPEQSLAAARLATQDVPALTAQDAAERVYNDLSAREDFDRLREEVARPGEQGINPPDFTKVWDAVSAQIPEGSPSASIRQQVANAVIGRLRSESREKDRADVEAGLKASGARTARAPYLNNLLEGAGQRTPDWARMQLVASIFVETDQPTIALRDILGKAYDRLRARGLDVPDNDQKTIEILDSLTNLGLLRRGDNNTYGIAVSKRLLAVKMNDVKFIRGELAAAIRSLEAQTDDAARVLTDILEEYARITSLWHLAPIESRYPVLKAASLLDKPDLDRLADFVAGNAQLNRLPLGDALMLMTRKEPPADWIERNAPGLKGRTIYYVSPETWFVAGGLGRVGQYHTVRMKQLVRDQADVVTIEPYYPYKLAYNRQSGQNELQRVDYRQLPVPIEGMTDVPAYEFDVKVRGQVVKAQVYKGRNKYGIETYLIKDANESITKLLYRYGQYGTGSWEEFAEFLSRASEQLMQKLEAEKQARAGAAYKPAVISLNDGQLGLFPAYKRLSDESGDPNRLALKNALTWFVTHTYRNRGIYGFANGTSFLQGAGIPQKLMPYFRRIDTLDATSGGRRLADGTSGVAAIHAAEVGPIDPQVVGYAITNGDNREATGEAFVAILKELFPDADPDRPTVDQVIAVKLEAKKRLKTDARLLALNPEIANIDPERPLIGYYGRLVEEKAGRERAFHDSNLRALVKMGVTVIHAANVQSHTQAMHDELVALANELNAQGPGKLIILTGWSLPEQVTMLAATDWQIQDSDRGTEAAGFTESNVNRTAGLMGAATGIEGIQQQQGILLDWNTPGQGNTIVPAADTPEAWLERYRQFVDAYQKNLAEFHANTAMAVPMSMMLDASLTAAEYLRQFAHGIERKENPVGVIEAYLRADTEARDALTNEWLRKELIDALAASGAVQIPDSNERLRTYAVQLQGRTLLVSIDRQTRNIYDEETRGNLRPAEFSAFLDRIAAGERVEIRDAATGEVYDRYVTSDLRRSGLGVIVRGPGIQALEVVTSGARLSPIKASGVSPLVPVSPAYVPTEVFRDLGFTVKSARATVLQASGKVDPAALLNDPLSASAYQTSVSQAVAAYPFKAAGENFGKLADANAVTATDRALRDYVQAEYLAGRPTAVVVFGDEGAKDLSSSLGIGDVYYFDETAGQAALRKYKDVPGGLDAAFESLQEFVRANRDRLAFRFYTGDGVEGTSLLTQPEPASENTGSVSIASFLDIDTDWFLGENGYLSSDDLRIHMISGDFDASDLAGLDPYSLPADVLKALSVKRGVPVERLAGEYAFFALRRRAAEEGVKAKDLGPAHANDDSFRSAEAIGITDIRKASDGNALPAMFGASGLVNLIQRDRIGGPEAFTVFAVARNHGRTLLAELVSNRNTEFGANRADITRNTVLTGDELKAARPYGLVSADNRPKRVLQAEGRVAVSVLTTLPGKTYGSEMETLFQGIAADEPGRTLTVRTYLSLPGGVDLLIETELEAASARPLSEVVQALKSFSTEGAAQPGPSGARFALSSYRPTEPFFSQLNARVASIASTPQLSSKRVQFQVVDGAGQPTPDQTLRSPRGRNVQVSKDFLDIAAQVYDSLPTDPEKAAFLEMIGKGLHNAALHVETAPSTGPPGIEASLAKIADPADFREVAKLIALFWAVPSINTAERLSLARAFLKNARTQFSSYMFAFIGNPAIADPYEYHVRTAEALIATSPGTYLKRVAHYHAAAALYESLLRNPSDIKAPESNPEINRALEAVRATRPAQEDAYSAATNAVVRHRFLERAAWFTSAQSGGAVAAQANEVLSDPSQLEKFVSGTETDSGDSVYFPENDAQTTAISMSRAEVEARLKALGRADLINDVDLQPVDGKPNATIVTGRLLTSLGEGNLTRVRQVISAGGLGSRYVERVFPEGSTTPQWKEKAKGSTKLPLELGGRVVELSFNQAKIFQAAAFNSANRDAGRTSSKAENAPVQFITSQFTHADTVDDLETMGYTAYAISELRSMRDTNERVFRDLLARHGIPTEVAELSDSVTVFVHRDDDAPVVYLDFLANAAKLDQRTGDFYSNVDPGLPEKLTGWPLGHDASMVEGLTTGLDRMLNKSGRTFSFLGNIDNLGATVDPRLLGILLLTGKPLIAESAVKDIGQKGGAPSRYSKLPVWYEEFARGLGLTLKKKNLTEGFEMPDEFFAILLRQAGGDKGRLNALIMELQGEFNTANYVRSDEDFQRSVVGDTATADALAADASKPEGRSRAAMILTFLLRLVNNRYEGDKQIPAIQVTTLAGAVTSLVDTEFVKVPRAKEGSRFEPKKEYLSNLREQLEFTRLLVRYGIQPTTDIHTITQLPAGIESDPSLVGSPKGPSAVARLAYLKEDHAKKDKGVNVPKTLAQIETALSKLVAEETQSLRRISDVPMKPVGVRLAFVPEELGLDIQPVTVDRVRAAMANFQAETERGIRREASSLKMLDSFVPKRTGRENGKYFALDLGGTNLRVAVVEMKDGREVRRKVYSSNTVPAKDADRFALPPSIISGDAEPFFDYAADVVKYAAEQEGLPAGRTFQLGFSFAFPVRQTAVDKGTLVEWTKGFGVRDVVVAPDASEEEKERRDVVRLLNDAFGRRGVDNVRANALVNDTVATLTAVDDAEIGAILGTGTNGAYFGPESAYNTEWGAFNAFPEGFITRYDRLLDEQSENPGKQILEKVVSGKYIGEVARLILADLAANGRLERRYDVLSTRNALTARVLTSIVDEVSPERTVIERAFPGATPADKRVIAAVADYVLARSAAAFVTAVSAIVAQTDPELTRPHTVAVDGSLFAESPSYRLKVYEANQAVWGDRRFSVNYVLAKDATGVGAAVVSAIVDASRPAGARVAEDVRSIMSAGGKDALLIVNAPLAEANPVLERFMHSGKPEITGIVGQAASNALFILEGRHVKAVGYPRAAVEAAGIAVDATGIYDPIAELGEDFNARAPYIEKLKTLRQPELFRSLTGVDLAAAQKSDSELYADIVPARSGKLKDDLPVDKGIVGGAKDTFDLYPAFRIFDVTITRDLTGASGRVVRLHGNSPVILEGVEYEPGPVTKYIWAQILKEKASAGVIVAGDSSPFETLLSDIAEKNGIPVVRASVNDPALLDPSVWKPAGVRLSDENFDQPFLTSDTQEFKLAALALAYKGGVGTPWLASIISPSGAVSRAELAANAEFRAALIEQAGYPVPADPESEEAKDVVELAVNAWLRENETLDQDLELAVNLARTGFFGFKDYAQAKDVVLALFRGARLAPIVSAFQADDAEAALARIVAQDARFAGAEAGIRAALSGKGSFDVKIAKVSGNTFVAARVPNEEAIYVFTVGSNPADPSASATPRSFQAAGAPLPAGPAGAPTFTFMATREAAPRVELVSLTPFGSYVYDALTQQLQTSGSMRDVRDYVAQSGLTPIPGAESGARLATLDRINALRVEGGIHTEIGEQPTFRGVAPERLAAYAGVQERGGIMTGLDTPELVRAARAQNPDAVLILNMQASDFETLREGALAGANAAVVPQATPEFVARARSDAATSALVLFAEVNDAAADVKAALDTALRSGADGVLLKRFDRVEQSLVTAGYPLSRLRSEYPSLVIGAAGGVFENRVAQVLSRPERLVAFVGVNQTEPERFEAQIRDYTAAIAPALSAERPADGARLAGERLTPEEIRVVGERIAANLQNLDPAQPVFVSYAIVAPTASAPVSQPVVVYTVVSGDRGDVSVRSVEIDNREALAAAQAPGVTPETLAGLGRPASEAQTFPNRSTLVEKVRAELRAERTGVEKPAVTPAVPAFTPEIADTRTVIQRVLDAVPALGKLAFWTQNQWKLYGHQAAPLDRSVLGNAADTTYVVGMPLVTAFDENGFESAADFQEGARVNLAKLERAGFQGTLMVALTHRGAPLSSAVRDRIEAKLSANQQALGGKIRFTLVEVPQAEKLAEGLDAALAARFPEMKRTGMSVGLEIESDESDAVMQQRVSAELANVSDNLKQLKDQGRLNVFAVARPKANQTVSFAGVLVIATLNAAAVNLVRDYPELAPYLKQTDSGFGFVIVLLKPQPLTAELEIILVAKRATDSSA